MREFDVSKYISRNRPYRMPSFGNAMHAVVIPIYNELDSFAAAEHSIRTALSHIADRVMVIAVINYPPDADAGESEALLNLIRAGVFPEVVPLYLPKLTGGVGAARKAGMDAFIATLKASDLEKSVIFSLDADTLISPDYFQKVLPEALKGGAVSIGFSHQIPADSEHAAAIAQYEAYLARYVDKLREAGSPYAFFTVGSAFAVRCDAYVKAGGMKIREAGEDFYFLQAAAKTSEVRSIAEKLVHPSARISTRVPFGTGQAVASLLRGEPLTEIPDGAFAVLKKVLEKSPDRGENGSTAFLCRMPAAAAEFFIKENFPAAWEKICRNLPQSKDAAAKAFHEWFDGLKTLRFLHFLS